MASNGSDKGSFDASDVNQKFRFCNISTASNQSNPLRQPNNLTKSTNKEGMKNNVGYCNACGKLSGCMCKRCGDYYCSPECQRNDWPKHRYICLPMPPLVSSKIECDTYETAYPLQENILQSQQESNNENHNKHNIEPVTTKQSVEECNSNQKSANMSLGYKPVTIAYPKNGSRVFLTSFKTVNRVYIRPAELCGNENYNAVIKKVRQYGPNATKLNAPPKIYSYVITTFNNQFYRAKVMNHRDGRFELLLIDIGFMQYRYLREIYEISKEIIELPCYIHLVQINGVQFTKFEKPKLDIRRFEGKSFRIEWVKEGIEAKFFHWESEKQLLTDEILGNENSRDESIKSNNQNNLRKNLKDTACTSYNDNGQNTIKNVTHDLPNKTTTTTTTIDQESDMNSTINVRNTSKSNNNAKSLGMPCMKPPFEIVLFPKNAKNLKVVAINSSTIEYGCVGCMAEEHVTNLLNVQKYLSRDFKDDGIPYKPIANEYCIALFESDWYRAKVMNVLADDQYYITYIDFTNEATVSSNCIRPYPMELTNPCCTNLCLITNLPAVLNKHQIEFLKDKLCFKKSFLIDSIVNIEEDMVMIECQQLIEKMREHGTL